MNTFNEIANALEDENQRQMIPRPLKEPVTVSFNATECDYAKLQVVHDDLIMALNESSSDQCETSIGRMIDHLDGERESWWISCRIDARVDDLCVTLRQMTERTGVLIRLCPAKGDEVFYMQGGGYVVTSALTPHDHAAVAAMQEVWLKAYQTAGAGLGDIVGDSMMYLTEAQERFFEDHVMTKSAFLEINDALYATEKQRFIDAINELRQRA